MKSVKKLIETVVLVILIVLVLVLIGFSLFGESLIKTGIETAGTKTLSVAVNIGDLDLSVFRGIVGMKNLVVANPTGYEHKNLLEMRDGRVKAGLRSLLSDTVEIEYLNLDGINLAIEQKGTTNNLQEILNAIPKPKDPAPAAEPGKEPKKLHVKKLNISNVKVAVKLLPIPGQADTINLELDPIVMTDLGSDDKLTTAKLTKEVILAIAKGIAKKGAGILPADMIGSMDAVASQASEIIDEARKTIEAGKEEAQKTIESGKGVLEGILKPKE